MSIYTQQINNMVERLPETDQQFVYEFVKKISRGNTSLSDLTESELKLLHEQQKKAVKSIIKNLNALEPLADDPIDEILIKGITLRTPEDLDLL